MYVSNSFGLIRMYSFFHQLEEEVTKKATKTVSET